MTDVTIPADTARQVANELRYSAMVRGETSPEASALLQWADLLDPPPSLRDEVALLVRNRRLAVLTMSEQVISDDKHTDVVLAAVRRHVEALPHPSRAADSQGLLHRDDVLRLLGGDQ